MARQRPPDRFQQLIVAATEVFTEAGGFRRAQIRDVATAMGVAKGTVYLYVESKEALFDLVLRYADRVDAPQPELPVPTPASGDTAAHFRGLLERHARFEVLREAAERAGPRVDIATELDAILDEIFDVLSAHRTTIRLVNLSARDVPELALLWYEAARGGLNRRLAAYLAHRAAEGHLRADPSPVAMARFITELTHWFAVQRHFDPYPDPLDDETARSTVKTAVLRTLLPEPEVTR